MKLKATISNISEFAALTIIGKLPTEPTITALMESGLVYKYQDGGKTHYTFTSIGNLVWGNMADQRLEIGIL